MTASQLLQLTVLIAVSFVVNIETRWLSPLQILQREPEFSVFYSLVKNVRAARLALQRTNLTVFAPTNDAFRKFVGVTTHQLILYHVVFGVVNFKREQSRGLRAVHTCCDENPPLWIKTANGSVWVNNAEVLVNYSNYYEDRKSGVKQALHVVDRVLDPIVNDVLSVPDAYDFLAKPEVFGLHPGVTSDFLSAVIRKRAKKLFNAKGGYTFLVPLEVTGDFILEGHIINDVIFTRTSLRGFSYSTAANGSFACVHIVFTNNGRNLRGKIDGESGDYYDHTTDIIRGDFPVKNGVVHLIKKPLSVAKRKLTLFPYLGVFYKVSSDPDLSIAYDLARREGLDEILKASKGVFTYFVPKNKAWRELNLEDITGNVVKKHLVISNVSYTIKDLTKTTWTLNTLSGSVTITAKVSKGGLYVISTPERDVSVSRPDYVCSDGIVHVIDEPFFSETSPPESGLLSHLNDFKNVALKLFYSRKSQRAIFEQPARRH